MIEYLSGKVVEKSPSAVIINCQGVGYGVEIPFSTAMKVGNLGEEVSLWIYTRVREDSFKLYGFFSKSERQLFILLIDIHGVGPKLAIAILSTLSPEELHRTIEFEEVEKLLVVPGVGKKTGEKIILELKSKKHKLPALDIQLKGSAVFQQKLLGRKDASEDIVSTVDQLWRDLFSALENLGFKEKDIAPAVSKVKALHPKPEDLALLIKQTLTEIKQGATRSSRFYDEPSRITPNEDDKCLY